MHIYHRVIACSLLATLTVSACAETPNDSWQVAITGATVVNQHAYLPTTQDAGHTATWTNSGNGTALDQVNTFQLTAASAMTTDTTLTITPPASSSSTNCAELFYKNQQAFVPINAAVNLRATFPGISGPDSTTPIHLTAIPYDSGAATCTVPVAPKANNAIAIWLSSESELPASVVNCELSGTVSESDLPLAPSAAAFPKCPNIIQPQWSVVQPDKTVPQYFLKYSGPLAQMVKQGKPIVIKLDDDADIQFPITTQYVQYPTSLTTDAQKVACQTALTPYNAKRLSAKPSVFPYAACGLSTATAKFVAGDDMERSYTYSEPFALPIYVTGFGRIDGSTTITNYLTKLTNPAISGGVVDRPCHLGANKGSIDAMGVNAAQEPEVVCAIPSSSSTTDYGLGGDYVRYAQWRIDTSLLGLSSSYMPQDAKKDKSGQHLLTYTGTDPAIYIDGITVADTPIRNRGTVQLNVAQFGFQGSREANNTPVVVNDFKQVGSWMDATDGPDIGSDGAIESNLYYQITDDSAKLEAQSQSLKNVTLIQGGVGGVMLGMYGVTRDGIDGSVVNGVYVPRIIQQPNDTTYSVYGATHGLISTRTCPRYYQGFEADTVMPSIANATVENVKVFALTDHSAAAIEPNYLDSLAAVGVGGSSGYCSSSFDTKTIAPDFTFGPLHLYGLQSDIAPQEPFIFYDDPGTTADNYSVNVVWNGVDFGADPTQSAKYYVSGSVTDAVYNYICPLTSSVTMLTCMQQTGGAAAVAVAANASNLTVLGPAGGPSVPYLSTTVYPAVTTEGLMATPKQLAQFGMMLSY